MPPPIHCVTHLATYPRTHSHTYVLWHAVASWRSYSPDRTNAPKQPLTRANPHSRFHGLTDCQLLLTHPFTDSQPGSRTHCTIHALPHAPTNPVALSLSHALTFRPPFPNHSLLHSPTHSPILTHPLTWAVTWVSSLIQLRRHLLVFPRTHLFVPLHLISLTLTLSHSATL